MSAQTGSIKEPALFVMAMVGPQNQCMGYDAHDP